MYYTPPKDANQQFGDLSWKWWHLILKSHPTLYHPLWQCDEDLVSARFKTSFHKMCTSFNLPRVDFADADVVVRSWPSAGACRALHRWAPLKASLSRRRDSDHIRPVNPLNRVAGRDIQILCDAPGGTCKLLEGLWKCKTSTNAKPHQADGRQFGGNLLENLMKSRIFVTVSTPEVKANLRFLKLWNID